MSWQSIAGPFIQSFEGCRLDPYHDLGGVLTCGWGSTGPDVILGQPWTQAYADSRFEMSLNHFGEGVDEAIKVSLNDNQKAALTSFAYNLGINALKHSTLARKLNLGDYHGASMEFPEWCHVNQHVVDGLLRRRMAEQRLFNT